MITAIPSKKDTIDSLVDKRFGRAAFFCIYHEDEQKAEFIRNPFRSDGHGVGRRVVELMIEHRVDRVYAREFGPKAAQLMDRSGMRQAPMPDDINTVKQLIEKL